MNNSVSRLALITGGAGFIGTNLAERLLQDPHLHVRVFDNLSRGGVQRNVAWLQSRPGAERLEIVQGDIRSVSAVERAVRGATEIYHLAAQVAVTTSLDDPETDFYVNAAGTFHLLEAVRRSRGRPFFLFTSTNKVYGSLPNLPVQVSGSRYEGTVDNFCGIDETYPLDFHSPYGCSKGSADQYVRDYGRIYDLPTVVFRMSCIAGPRQFGNEDQGWVAHFLYSALADKSITVFGNGCQVRDVLHVQDLVDAMLAARDQNPAVRGDVYNLGGGKERSASVLEMLRAIEKLSQQPLRLEYNDVRPGDQPLYIADTAKLQRDTGWTPTRTLDETLRSIQEFWQQNEDEIRSHFSSQYSSLVAEEVA